MYKQIVRISVLMYGMYDTFVKLNCVPRVLVLCSVGGCVVGVVLVVKYRW